jgi:L,D-transpeptidase YcbB
VKNAFRPLMIGLGLCVLADYAQAAEKVTDTVVLTGPAAAARARARAAGQAAPLMTPALAVRNETAAVAQTPSGPGAAALARARAQRGGDPVITGSLPVGAATAKPVKKRIAKRAPKNWRQALAQLNEQKKANGALGDPVLSTGFGSKAADTGKAKEATIVTVGTKKTDRKSVATLTKTPKPLEPITDDFSIFGGSTVAGEEPLTDKGLPVIATDNVEPLKAAIERYSAIVAKGGWPITPALQMEVGTSHAAVATLRQRLQAEGDLGPESVFSTEYYGTDVEEAVRRFQQRNGLAQTGDLLDKDRAKNGSRSVTALNVPASARLAQLKVNLTRIQSGARWASDRYVLVNLPDQEVQAVENGRVVLRLAGVVGRPDRPSPALTSTIYEVKFNPTWTMPPTVLKEDFVPRGRQLQGQNVSLLRKAGIDAYDGSGRIVDPDKINFNSAGIFNYRFVQQPGKENPLGFAKLEFGSPESVYMHDTPSAKLFGKPYRAASSGCIRVENMEKLVRWLLKDTAGWSAERIAQIKQSGESDIVRLTKGVPLQWVYVTAWADASGVTHFRRDIYGRDQAFGVDKIASTY